uniref:Caspase 9, apoptosis-related cysteine peptidase n=1 Tax=Electrophorus electricus TaxID=8005 RepID=A0AAY5EFP7_ELEEL
MDASQKNILQLNRTNIVKDLDPSNVYDGLLSRGIFTEDMIDEIKSAGTRRDQARQLVKDLQMRGSRAFPAFLECLRETGHHTLPDRGDGPQKLVPLKPALPILCMYRVPSLKALLRNPNIPFPVAPEGESLAPRLPRPRRESIQSYKIEANPCGLCLIINNVDFDPASDLKNRAGSDIDCDKLKRAVRIFQLFFGTDAFLSHSQEIKHQLSVLATCFCNACSVSSDVQSNNNRFPGAVHGVDGRSVPVQIMTNYLNGKNCPSLQSKPKLFFIQACGGGEKDTGFEVSPDEVRPMAGGMDDQTDAIPTSSSSDSLSLSDEPDARATLPTTHTEAVLSPGYVSWRDSNTGSWYVETLDCILEQNAATDDLVTMLMMVNNEVSQISAKGLYKQMPGSFNFLRKLFYFQTSKT